jgi:hypothetical protein
MNGCVYNEREKKNGQETITPAKIIAKNENENENTKLNVAKPPTNSHPTPIPSTMAQKHLRTKTNAFTQSMHKSTPNSRKR